LVDTALTLAFLPSPPVDGFHVGPVHIRAYGLLIALGAVVAVEWAARRWEARGGDRREIHRLAAWALPAGLVGARVYHVVTDNQLYRGHWLNALKVWDGGLGIWGGVLAGVVVGLVVARHDGLPGPQLLDTVAPTIPLAQAIGRWGNWFNQELFGRPTRLPWGLHIDVAHRPAGFQTFTTFHPTFLYESLWDLAVVGIVLWAERRLNLRPGRLFAVYVAAYTFGRFFIEWLRIDPSHRFLGLRLNDWTSVVVFIAACTYLLASRLASHVDGDAADTRSVRTRAARQVDVASG
jgi:prolipoprotein diacylglyceryl transferase